MSYTKQGYEYMGDEILKDFVEIGIFIQPGAQHYTGIGITFKHKIAEILSTEVSIVILTDIINSARYKNGAIEIIEYMMEHSMLQNWVKPELLKPVVEYLEFYIESKCQSAMKAKTLYKKVKELEDKECET